MKFHNKTYLKRIEEKERALMQLAFETAKRLNGVKPTDSITYYESKDVKYTEKKTVKHGFLNLFTKEIEETKTRREFVPKKHDVDGWILDSSLLEEWFWFGFAMDPVVRCEEYQIYYILRSDGYLENCSVKNCYSGIVYNSPYPHKEDCVIRNEETSIDKYGISLNTPEFDHLSDISILDLPRYKWKIRREDGEIGFRNFPLYLNEDQVGRNISEEEIVNNYGKALTQKLLSL